MDGTAVILTAGLFTAAAGRTAHGLVRGTERYRVTAIVDGPATAGRDAGELLDEAARGIPLCLSLFAAIAQTGRPDWLIVGATSPGGALPPELRPDLVRAAKLGIGIVSGLHEFLGDDPEIAAAARRGGGALIDLRRPRPRSELHFFTGEIRNLRVPRLAVLGTDCTLGKRTTTRRLLDACRAQKLRAELVFTDRPGWLQGHPYGFILDATPHDFVSGELEHQILRCAREARPDLILIAGRSGLRNPSGPCGTEILLAGGARGMILQHAAGRRFYKDIGAVAWPIPHPREDIELARLCGARTLAVTLHAGALDDSAARAEAAMLEDELALPVVLPLADGVDALLPLVRKFVAEERGRIHSEVSRREERTG